MTYKHKSFDQSEVLLELEKIANANSILKLSLFPDEAFESPDMRRPLGATPEQVERNKEIALKTLSTSLDLVGFVPVWGDVLDSIRGLYTIVTSKSDDDTTEGVLLLLSAVPLLGDLVSKGALYTFKGYRAAKSAGKASEFVAKSPQEIALLQKALQVIKSSAAVLAEKIGKLIKFILNFASLVGGFLIGFLSPQKSAEIANKSSEAANNSESELSREVAKLKALQKR